jgi:hypothetical protein
MLEGSGNVEGVEGIPASQRKRGGDRVEEFGIHGQRVWNIGGELDGTERLP